jgi:hypothetical protein
VAGARAARFVRLARTGAGADSTGSSESSRITIGAALAPRLARTAGAFLTAGVGSAAWWFQVSGNTDSDMLIDGAY